MNNTITVQCRIDASVRIKKLLTPTTMVFATPKLFEKNTEKKKATASITLPYSNCEALLRKEYRIFYKENRRNLPSITLNIVKAMVTKLCHRNLKPLRAQVGNHLVLYRLKGYHWVPLPFPISGCSFGKKNNIIVVFWVVLVT